MYKPTRTQVLGATVAVALSAWLGLAAIGLRSGAAQAQGLMSAPACQCSAPTAIPGLDTSLVHCVCGGMACVLSQHAAKGQAENRMQCVR